MVNADRVVIETSELYQNVKGHEISENHIQLAPGGPCSSPSLSVSKSQNPRKRQSGGVHSRFENVCVCNNMVAVRNGVWRRD